MTISESHKHEGESVQKLPRMRWGLVVSLHRFLCVLPLPLYSPPSPFFPAVSWGFGLQNQANHMIMVQMAIISACESDISGHSRVWEIPPLLQRWIMSQKNSVWVQVLYLSVQLTWIFFWTFSVPKASGVVVLVPRGFDPCSCIFLEESTREVCAGLCQPHWGGLWVLNPGR